MQWDSVSQCDRILPLRPIPIFVKNLHYLDNLLTFFGHPLSHPIMRSKEDIAMIDTSWEVDFARFIERFEQHLGNIKQRKNCHGYTQGLIGRKERKCMEGLADYLQDHPYESIQHFMSNAQFSLDSLLRELAGHARELIGGLDARLIFDDTAIRKKGKASVGVARQYVGEVGKVDNSQVLVTATFAGNGLTCLLGLDLYLPREWTDDPMRMDKVGVPKHRQNFLTKSEIALQMVDRYRAWDVAFGPTLADAGYGDCVKFRNGLSQQGLFWTIGVSYNTLVYPHDVTLSTPASIGRGRPCTHPVPDIAPVGANKFLADAN